MTDREWTYLGSLPLEQVQQLQRTAIGLADYERQVTQAMRNLGQNIERSIFGAGTPAPTTPHDPLWDELWPTVAPTPITPIYTARASGIHVPLTFSSIYADSARKATTRP